MRRNLVIFLIIITLFIFIALVGYLIYLLQNRLSMGRRAGSESEASEA